MSKPKHQDPLYSYIKRNIENSLDLEYAIRASESINPQPMKELKELELAIVKFWLKRGATESEARGEILDMAWDTLQVGVPLSRRHNRTYEPEFLSLINHGLLSIREDFTDKLDLLAIPAARFYRVCDLLSGTNIPQAIAGAKSSLASARKYLKNDEIPLSGFNIHMREPIRLHPAFRFGTREDLAASVAGFEVDLTGDLDLSEWRRQVNEFQYRYAVFRAEVNGRHDAVSRELIQDFLLREHMGSQAMFEVSGIDGFLPALTGLYCWDRYKRDNLTLTDSIYEAINLHPSGYEAMRTNYRNASDRIKKMAARFEKPPTVLPRL
jgi:hypothetical protein